MHSELADFLTRIEKLQSQKKLRLQFFAVNVGQSYLKNRISGFENKAEATIRSDSSKCTNIRANKLLELDPDSKKHRFLSRMIYLPFLKHNFLLTLFSTTTKTTLMNRSFDPIDETSNAEKNTFRMWSVFDSFTFNRSYQMKKSQVKCEGGFVERILINQHHDHRLLQFFYLLTKKLSITQIFSQEVKSL